MTARQGASRATQDRVASHAGVDIAVRDFGGTGPDIVLLHGFTRTLADWSLMAPHLVPNYRVVAFDLRCHGRSGEARWEWADVMGDLEAVCAELALTRPSLVGHSLGGMIAELYSGAGGACSAVVNLDGHGEGRPSEFDGVAADVARERSREMAALAAASMPAAGAVMTRQDVEHERALAGQMGTALGIAEEALLEGFERNLVSDELDCFYTKPSASARAAIDASIRALDVFALHRAVRVPLLIYHAIAAHPMEATGPEWLAEHLQAHRRGLGRELSLLAASETHVQVRSVEATHALILERPAELAADITAFLTASGVGSQ